MKLSEALDHFITACKAEGLAPKTITWYTCRLNPFIEAHKDFLLTEVNRHHIRAYIVALRERDFRYEKHPYNPKKEGGLSPSTVEGHVRAIRRLFGWVESEGYIKPEENPMLGVKTPRLPKQMPKAIDYEDFKRLLRLTEGDETVKRRDRAILLFLADTGVRIGGLVGLRIEDIDFNRNIAVVVEKGSKPRPVPFTDVTADAIKAWLDVRPKDRGDHVFISLRYKATITPSGVSQMLRRLKRRAGVNGRVNPHSFRHGFAREYLLNGGDLGTLSDLMGHTDVKVTKDFYGAFSTEELVHQHNKYSPISHLHEE